DQVHLDLELAGLLGKHQAEQRGRWEDPKFYQEREVIEAFLALPAAQRKVVREVVMALAIAANADSGKKPG
ncbi:transcriptional regulator, partial [Pseudomonas sp. OA3]|nr:transcriptional regulator [Pseudomonas sp. OA3]